MKKTLMFLLALMLLVLGALAEQPAGTGEVVVVTSEGRALRYGDKGEDVKLLQTRLKDLRYYNGPVTGNYLELTRKAVRAVQEAYGLEATGDANLSLQEIIYGDAHRPLKKGDSGKDVSRLQTRLSELGYYWGKIWKLSGRHHCGGWSFSAGNGLENRQWCDYPDQAVL